MAIERELTAVPVKAEERTWRATMETPKGGPYSLSIHREVVSLDAEGKRVGEAQQLPAIVVPYDTIKGEAVTFGGQTLKVEQLCGFIAAYFDQKSAQLAEKAQ